MNSVNLVCVELLPPMIQSPMFVPTQSTQSTLGNQKVKDTHWDGTRPTNKVNQERHSGYKHYQYLISEITTLPIYRIYHNQKKKT